MEAKEAIKKLFISSKIIKFYPSVSLKPKQQVFPKILSLLCPKKKFMVYNFKFIAELLFSFSYTAYTPLVFFFNFNLRK